MAGELNYKAGIDISNFIKSRDEILKSFKQLKDTAGAALGGGISTPNTQGINAYRQAQLQMQQSLRDARLETERLKIEQQNLRNELALGRVTQQSYRTETARIAAEQAALRAATVAARSAQTATSGSYREAQERLKALGLEIRNTTGGFNAQGAAQRARIDEYRRLNAELTAFDRTMGNHQRNVGNYSSALQGVGRSLAGLAAGYLTAQAALAGLTSVIRTNAEISDSLANVQRTAGLTAKEAENLAEQLKKIDTRTSLKGLFDIAVIGGQLGIASNQLGGFTKAIDQLAVSLGGELKGGAEGVAKSLGVLDNVFKVTQGNGGDVEKSFNQIGSAILGLGQSGLATGDFLADFGERVGGVAKQAGLSLPVILSYGAVLQENGVNAEVAGTSFKKLISLMGTRRNDFFTVAQIADSNLTIKEFTDTINTDTQKALELFFNGLQKGGTKTTAFLDILKSSGLAMSGVSQSVAALSGNQESLNIHIADATRDFNEATKSAEQFAIKNDNLAASMEKFSNTVSNMVTDGGLSNFFKQGVDGATQFMVYLDKLVNSQSWNEFGVRLRGGDASSFDKANSLKAGLEKNSTLAFNNSNTPNLYKQDAEALKKSFSETKAAAIDATVKYNTFKNAIIKGTLKDDGSLNAYKQNADILVKQANDLARAYEQAREKAAKNRKPANNGSDFVLPGDAKLAKAAARAKEAAAKAQETALKRQRTLQAEIDSLTKKGVASKLDADQQEIVSVEEKYKKLRAKAIAFNNAKDSKGQKVNVSGLNAAETAEKLEITQKTEAKVLAKSLDEQAKYYAEFEDLKTKIGEQKAKERYANLIDVDKTYLESLAKQEEDLLNPGKAKGGSENEADANPFAMKLLAERIAAANLVQQKEQDELLADFMSYQEKRKLLTEKYNKQMLLLGDDAEAKTLRTEQYQSELDALNDNELKKTEIYKRAAAEAVVITRQQAQQQIEALSKILESGVIPTDQASKIQTQIDRLRFTLKIGVDDGNIASLKDEFTRVAQQLNATDASGERLILSEENYRAIIQRLAQIQSEIDAIDRNGDGKSTWGDKVRAQFEYLDGDASQIATGLAKDLGQLSSSFGELSNALGGNNTEAGYFLDTLSSLTKAGEDAAGAFASFATGDIIGGISKTISAVTSVLSIGKKVREMNEAARKEVEDFYKNAIAGEREYQDLLKERELQTIRNNKLVLQGIRDELSLRRSQSADYNKEAAEIMSKIQGQSYVSAEKYVHGTWFRKAKVEKTYSSLQGKSFEQLSQLLAQGKLEGEAQALVERLKELEAKGYDAEQAIADLARETSELFTGTTSSNLTDSLLEMFKSGKTGAQDLAEFFKQSMDEAALSIFKNKVLAGAMEDFYKKFDTAAQSGDQLTDSEIAQLQIDFGKMTDNALKKFDEYKKITGSDLAGPSSNSSNNQNSLQGAIRAITVDQANVLSAFSNKHYSKTREKI